MQKPIRRKGEQRKTNLRIFILIIIMIIPSINMIIVLEGTNLAQNQNDSIIPRNQNSIDASIYFSIPKPGSTSITYPQEYIKDYDPLPPSVASTTNIDTDYCVILVSFNDANFTHTLAQISDLIFSETSGMKAYFKENSYNQFLITGSIVGATSYFIDVPTSYYGADGPNNAIDMLNGHPNRLALDLIEGTDTAIDYSQYDTNGDGTVDHLIIVHAGYGQEVDPENTDLIWSHYSGVIASTDDDVDFADYMVVSEYGPMGVIAHEASHDLGLTDLYDIDYSSDGVGFWGIMGAGAWLESPSHIIGYNKILLGWVIPTIIESFAESDREVRQFSKFGDVLKLPINDEEFFLVENRYASGTIFDLSLPGPGLLITHIDESQPDNSRDERRLVDVEEADGNNELDTYGGYYGEAGDVWVGSDAEFSSDSDPSTRDNEGTPTNWKLYDFSTSGETQTVSIQHGILNDLKINNLTVPLNIALGSSNGTSNQIFDSTLIQINATISQTGINIANNSQVTFQMYKNNLSEEALVIQEVSNIPQILPNSSLSLNWTININRTDLYIARLLIENAQESILENNEILKSFRAYATVEDMDWDFESDVAIEEAKWNFAYERFNRLGIVKTTSLASHEWELRTEDVQEDIDRATMPTPETAWHFGYHEDLSVWGLEKLSVIEGYNATMTLASPLDLSEYDNCYFSFYAKYILAEITDANNTQTLATQTKIPLAADEIVQNIEDQNLVRLRVSTDGNSWTDLQIFYGIQDKWSLYYYNLSTYSGQSIYLSFRIELQNEVPGGGFFFDSIKLTDQPFKSEAYFQFIQENIMVPNNSIGTCSVKLVNLGDFTTTFTISLTINTSRIVISTTGTSVTLWPNNIYHLTIQCSPSSDANIGDQGIITSLVVFSDHPENGVSDAELSRQDTISVQIGENEIINENDDTGDGSAGDSTPPDPLIYVILGLVIVGIIGTIYLKTHKNAEESKKTSK